MQELIDLIIFQLRDEPNQEFSINWDGEEWSVDVVNPSSNVALGEVGGKYQTSHSVLIIALNLMTELPDAR